MPSPDVFLTILKISGVFIGVSFIVFWVGLVWWVAQDALSRTEDKIILAAAVAMTAILGPVGALLYLVIRPKQTLQESVGEMMEREMLLHASSTTICPTCGRMALEDFVACPHCATLLKEHCPQCQKLVSVEWSHCPYCAAKLQPKRFPEALSRNEPARQPSGPTPANQLNPSGSIEIVTSTTVQETLPDRPVSATPSIGRAQSLTKASAQAVQKSTRSSLAILKEVFSSTRSTMAARTAKGDGSISAAAKTGAEAAPLQQHDVSVEAPVPAAKPVADSAFVKTAPVIKSSAVSPSGSRRAKNHRANKK